MIGVYDYTVILTYFFMISGILDAFDGRVARTKKNRSEFEKNFGVQIDSLADLICFGVLPAAIGLAQLRISGRFTEIVAKKDYEGSFAFLILLLVIAVFYVLAALIRLAYYNATCDVRSKEEHESGVTYFIGLPVTTSALIFPLEMILQLFCGRDLTVIYFIIMLLMAMAFVMNIRVRKPGRKGLTVLLIIGLIELAACVVSFNLIP